MKFLKIRRNQPLRQVRSKKSIFDEMVQYSFSLKFEDVSHIIIKNLLDCIQNFKD